MTENFALFDFHQNEASGGLDDLAHVGTFDECVEKGEAIERQHHCHIARVSDLKIVRRGRWSAKSRADITGLTKDLGTYDWHFVWVEVE